MKEKIVQFVLMGRAAWEHEGHEYPAGSFRNLDELFAYIQLKCVLAFNGGHTSSDRFRIVRVERDVP